MSQLQRPELAGMLFQEIEGYIPKIENSIAVLQSCSTDQDALKETHRLFHNIKGAASQVAFNDLRNSAAICETLIANLMESSIAPTETQLEFLGTVNSHIREFCTLNNKTSQAEQFLFTTTLSFFRKMMEQSGPENPIILPEHIHTLLKTDENHAPAGDGFLDDTDCNLQLLHLECLASLRSIVPLLQELTDCSKKIEMETLSPGILQPITSALSTLALCSRVTGLKAQEQLLSSFLDILETLRQCPGVADRTILGVLQELLSYLDLFVSLPPQEGESAIATVLNSLAQFVHLFREASFLPKPFSAETAEQRATSRNADHVTAGQPESQHIFHKSPDSPQEDGSALPVDTSSIRVKSSDLEELVNIEGERVVSRGSIEKLLNTFSQSLDELATVKDTLRRISRELDVSLEAQSPYRRCSGSPLNMHSAATLGNSERSELDPIERDQYSQLNLISHSRNDISIDVNAIHSSSVSEGSSDVLTLIIDNDKQAK